MGGVRFLAPVILAILLFGPNHARAQVRLDGATTTNEIVCTNSVGNLQVNNLVACDNTGVNATGVTVGTGVGATAIGATGITMGSAANLIVGGSTTTNGVTNTGNIGTTTLSTTGPATVGGTLGVTGATSLSTLNTSGAATLNSLGVTNNATVGGTLSVTGATSLNGGANVSNHLTVAPGAAVSMGAIGCRMSALL